jgi:hypothetical protein
VCGLQVIFVFLQEAVLVFCRKLYLSFCRKLYCQDLISRTFQRTSYSSDSSSSSSMGRGTNVDGTNTNAAASRGLAFKGSGGEGLVFADSAQLQQQQQQQLYKVCLWGATLARSHQQLQLLLQLGKSNKPNNAAAAYSTCSAKDHSMSGSGVDSALGATFKVAAVCTWGPIWLLRYGPKMPGTPCAGLNVSHCCCYCWSMPCGG